MTTSNRVTVPIKVNLPADVYRALMRQAAVNGSGDVGEMLAHLAHRSMLGRLSWQQPKRWGLLRGDAFVERFCELYDVGVHNSQIARELGVSPSSITNYVKTLRPNGRQ